MDISVVVIIKVQSTFWIYPPPPHTHTHFFESVLRPFQYYFSSYENGQSEGGAITGEPLEKNPPGTPASRTWLVSHVARAELEPTPGRAPWPSG